MLSSFVQGDLGQIHIEHSCLLLLFLLLILLLLLLLLPILLLPSIMRQETCKCESHVTWKCLRLTNGGRD